MTGAGGLATSPLSRAELGGLGFRLIVDPATPFLAMHRALRQCYAALVSGEPDPGLGGGIAAEQGEIHRTIDLEAMVEVERRTVER